MLAWTPDEIPNLQVDAPRQSIFPSTGLRSTHLFRGRATRRGKSAAHSARSADVVGLSVAPDIVYVSMGMRPGSGNSRHVAG
ncbi:hypothetical protein R1flu_020518 [Riccia fluitans]|uniref:Uncharacterized protein n=1 Tax=Riccia fluitans TaxID=41844 RepID=A0ABD1ZM37_9MARC